MSMKTTSTRTTLLMVALMSLVVFGVAMHWLGPRFGLSKYISVAVIFLVLFLSRLLAKGNGPNPSSAGRIQRAVLFPHFGDIGRGLLCMGAALLWAAVISLAVRYHILPDNNETGVVLVVPLLAFVVVGLFLIIRGQLRGFRSS
jgi:hypothetical protein